LDRPTAANTITTSRSAAKAMGQALRRLVMITGGVWHDVTPGVVAGR
jgi:hypothetical protein